LYHFHSIKKMGKQEAEERGEGEVIEGEEAVVGKSRSLVERPALIGSPVG